jgi:hypothetical protein
MPINLGGNEINSFGTKLLNDTGIITSSLTYYWDAGIVSSYPGSGTTWTDLTTSGRNITLNNGPAYSSAQGGGIVFDGTNDYGSFSTISFGNGNVAWTTIGWIKTTTTADGLGAGSFMSNASGGPVYAAMSVNAGRIAYWSYHPSLGGWYRSLGSVTVNDGAWHMLTWANTTSSTINMYVDANIDVSGAPSLSGNNNPMDWIGASWAAYSSMTIGSAFVYLGTLLTASQIRQIYNATRTRFGV